jgi:hypothetical protein
MAKAKGVMVQSAFFIHRGIERVVLENAGTGAELHGKAE